MSVSARTLIITSDDLRRLICGVGLNRLMDDLIERLHEAFVAYDPDDTVTPVRDGFHYETPHVGLVEWMPALRQGREAVIKLVGYHPENPETHGLPTILSSISSYSARTGHLLGLLDATFLTALRTGAASAVASRALAWPETRCLGIVGCGAQGVTQLHALSRVFELEQVLLYDEDPAASHSFPERCRAFLSTEPSFEVVAPERIVERADLISTATSVERHRGPVLPARTPQPHLHVNAVGSDFPGKVELPMSLLRQALVCPDFRDQAIREGECQQLEGAAIGPDLVTVLQAGVCLQAARERLTVFDSTGWALEDQIAMQLLLEYAKTLSIGTHVQIETIAEDPKDPYGFVSGRPEARMTETANDLARVGNPVC